MDEFNLISMNAEEFKAARKEYYDYAQKYFRYFHYRDKYKVARKPCLFRYPVGEAAREFLEGMSKRRRKYQGSTETIIQDVNQIKTMYRDKREEAFPQENKCNEENFVKIALEHGGKPVKVIPSTSTIFNIFDLDKPEITEELLNQKEQDLRALLEEANKHHMQGSLAAVEYLKRFDELPELRDNPKWKERVRKLFQEFAEQASVKSKHTTM